ncbi:calcium-binding protein [Albimonas sp. CAU 1670]|uniref:calcium-binding protein n=1 Tax=Albimonas sp. CAU 1670 TaxID=3032599 RepID=UPI0023DBE5E8|nr:calcium-binding protein [Albimonas sp. CAU 1670]MDF2233907.1 calcium-binding protein [Albimonas sp. CAU 1670]
MTDIVQTNASSTVVVGGGDSLYVPRDVLVTSSNSGITNNVVAGTLQVAIDGTVASLNDYGAFFLLDDAIDLSFSIGATGVLRAAPGSGGIGLDVSGSTEVDIYNDGSIFGNEGVHLAISGPSSRLTNRGTIQGVDASGMRVVHSGTAYLSNSGEIGGRSGAELFTGSFKMMNSGLIEAVDQVGILFSGTRLDLTNTGVILGSAAAVRTYAGTLFVDNLGEMRGSVTGGSESDYISNVGSIYGSVSLGGGGNTVLNSGLIEGTVASAELIDNITNSGEILGAIDAGAGANNILTTGLVLGYIFTGADLDEVTNRGVVGGQVILSGGDDVLRNSGDIESYVDLGDGSNVFINRGAVAGTVSADDGFDRIVNRGVIEGDVDVGDSADRIVNSGVFGGDVNLGAGNDRYVARGDGSTEGRVQGGDENDTLIGGALDDDFEGGAGYDMLKGRAGDDVLVGGAGKDTLVGGAGDDQMTGGGFRDEHRFGKHSGADVITDWVDGEDVLNLRKLGMTGGTKLGDVIAASQNRIGGEVIIDLDELGGDGSINVVGWNTALMSVDDFIF